MIMKCLAITLALFFAAPSVRAQEIDTLRTYGDRGGYVYYADPMITAQAARFDLSAPVNVRRIVVALSGPKCDTAATVHLYGHEGGLAAPGLGHDLMKPVVLRKGRAGFERIVVDIPTAMPIQSSQFFVAFDGLGKGVRLLSDRLVRPASCAAKGDRFTAQALRYGTDRWQWAPYGFLVDVVVERLKDRTVGSFGDVTVQLGFPDTTARVRSIAWSDVDDDGYLDLFLNGHLFRNMRGSGFLDISARVGIDTNAGLGFFADFDNDGRVDIITIARNRLRLYFNTGNTTFGKMAFDLPGLPEPSSVSIAEADGDGLLDVFVGGGSRFGETIERDILLVNVGRRGFTDRSDLLAPSGVVPGAGSGSQWADIDTDGDLDLYAAGTDNVPDRVWIRARDGVFRALTNADVTARSVGAARSGCHWADYDNDGDFDLLRPRRIPFARMRDRQIGVSPVVQAVGAGRFNDADDLFAYEEEGAAGAWGDMNNDGLDDLILLTSCGCRYAALYEQQAGGSFLQRTFAYGLARLAAGDDAVWVDYDNDGRLDLATFVNGRFRLFANTTTTANNWTQCDLVGPHAVGARVQVIADGRRSTQVVTAGRGLLMQDPARLHFGLGSARHIDTVLVQWSNGATTIYHDVAVNERHRLHEADGATASGSVSSAALGLAISPNPSAGRVRIGYTLTGEAPVVVEIHALDGALVRVLVRERQGGGPHNVEWDTRDDQGEPVAQGTYLCRISGGVPDVTGRVVLVR